MAVGDTTVIVLLTARGVIESLDERGEVLSRSSTSAVTESYRRYVETAAVAHG